MAAFVLVALVLVSMVKVPWGVLYYPYADIGRQVRDMTVCLMAT